ncbi:MAG TPA: hypothetical protein VGY56_14525 [Verrucomicrobiae bacterium]|nr:hypothetical protein [Verrucomicrobiae bacterium]
MIDAWCAKAWKGLSPARRKLWTKTLGFLERLPSQRVGIVLTIAVPLLVVAWHLVALAGRPAHLNEIVDALGSTSNYTFYNNPLPDNNGDRLLFIQSNENGYGVFLSVIGGAHRKPLDEETYQQTTWPTENLLGWSPDDRFFAYGRRRDASWQIVICDGNTGEELAVFLMAPRPVLGAWLSPNTFVYADQNNVIFSIENSQGKWLEPKTFRYFLDKSHTLPNAPMRNLVAFDDDSVVWPQGSAVWSCGKNSDAPAKIWDCTTNRFLEFSYSRAARRFLLHCADANGQFFTSFFLDRRDTPSSISRINVGEYNPSHVTLINDGKGYAFLSPIATSNELVIKLDDFRDAFQCQWFDRVEAFAAIVSHGYSSRAWMTAPRLASIATATVPAP